MAKLRLTVEDLRVDSFATDALEAGPRGTVEAHAKSAPFATCDFDTCNQATCAATQCNPSGCIDSCGATCQITCGDCFSVYVCD